MRVDWSDPVDWFGKASVEDAVGATLRSIGLVIAYWIAMSTLLYAATAIRRPHRPRAITLITLPFVRRMLDRTLATALAASIATAPLAPAMADEPPPPPVVFQTDDGIQVPHFVAPTEIVPIDQPAVVAPPAPSIPVVPVQKPPLPVVSTAPVTAPTTAVYTGYRVQTGDSLWVIAERHVASATGSAPTVQAITSYWRRLVDANRRTLRSGDPNLIFAGEIVTMPAVEVGS